MLAPVTVLDQPGFSNNRLSNRLANLPFVRPVVGKLRKRKLLKQLIRENISLIYSNTITNGNVLHDLAPLKRPVITHTHELEYWIHNTGKENFAYVRTYSTAYVAVSNAVRQNLIENHGIDEEMIHLVYGFLPPGLNFLWPAHRAAQGSSLNATDCPGGRRSCWRW